MPASNEMPGTTDLLNAQTGKIGWDELVRHFARGVVVNVEPGLDLLEIATCVVEDDSGRLQPLFDSGQVSRASDQHARRWSETKPRFWTVVAAPWVLVQEIPDDS